MSVIIKIPNIDHAKAGLTGVLSVFVCLVFRVASHFTAVETQTPSTWAQSLRFMAGPMVYGWAYGLWLGLACDQIQSGLAPGACALY